jgi:hypothetical protein
VISQPQVRNREIILTAKFVAVTFRQEEKPAPGKPGAPATAPGTPAPLRRGSTPQAGAPATSPAAVRARLEEAAKEGGEARVERALGGGSAAAPAPAPAPATGADQLKRGI